MSNYRFPRSATRTFADIYHMPFDVVMTDQGLDYKDYQYFDWFYDNCGVPDRLLTGPDYANYQLDTIYFLLMSRFANDHIKISDENRFKLVICQYIFQYGPQWQREMVLQDKLLNLSDDDLINGNTTIYNHAMHPDTEPSTQTLDEMEYIDDQNVTKYKRDGVDAFSRLYTWLDDKATNNFLRHFEKLFVVVAYGPSDIYREDDLNA